MRRIINFLGLFTLVAMTVLIASSDVSGQVYGGRAVGVSGIVNNNGSVTNINFADTGQLPSTGGSVSTTVQSASVPGTMTTGTLSANSSGALSSSQSVTVVNDLDLLVAGVRIRADRVTSNSGCICCPGADLGACSGSTTVDQLRITDAAGNTTTVSVGPGANQLVLLPGGVGSIIINEQVVGIADITVNGLRVTAAAGGITYNIVVASSASALECLSADPTPGPVVISGAVTSSSGTAIARAIVQLTDSEGNIQTVQTNSFGRFTFAPVEAGGSYVLSASHRNYSFSPVMINAAEDISVDIVSK